MPRPSRVAAPALLLATVVSASACSTTAPQSAEHSTVVGVQAQVGSILVSDAAMTPTGNGQAVVDLALYNRAGQADELTAASSSVATVVTLPQLPPTASAGASSPFTTTAGIVLPPQTGVFLDQPGAEISLSGFIAAPTVGETLPVTLTFAAAGMLTIDVPVLAATSTEPSPGPSVAASEANVDPPSSAGTASASP